MSLLADFLKIPPIKVLANKVLQPRALGVIASIKPFIKKCSTIIDIGAGGCQIAKELIGLGYEVTPVDVVDYSGVDDLKPLIYDGKKLPFKDQSFDMALLITVLHHIKDPEAVLKEAKRVAGEIIVIEDIYFSKKQKILTFMMDSAINFEFFSHPHSNKTDKEWRNLFKKLGLHLVNTRYSKFWKHFSQALYHLSTHKVS